jgi:hypothetical protein
MEFAELVVSGWLGGQRRDRTSAHRFAALLLRANLGNNAEAPDLIQRGARERPGVLPAGPPLASPLLVAGEAVAPDFVAAAAIVIYKAAASEGDAVILIATTVIILTMNDQLAGNLTSLVLPKARLLLFA